MKLLLLALCVCLLGCAGQTPTPKQQDEAKPSAKQVRGKTSSEWIKELAEKGPRKRLESVRSLVVFGPDEPGVGDALFSLLNDSDEEVMASAGIAMISFREKAIPFIKGKGMFVDPPGKATKQAVESVNSANPKRFPDKLSPLEELVYYNPWFAGGIIPSCVRTLEDEDPNFRLVAIKVLDDATAGRGTVPEKVIDGLKKASKDNNEDVSKAATELLQRLEPKEK